ncbi:ferrous iron transport protein B [Candidatus Synechococcus calcipolaris G9]|uniref:Ferrous iron transport protein B n=1 Tax=Candidatus Synechococcus calcipolaris G9 TaxID=1497997 RepID=A0ABT6EYC5_9SYNE|nr:ferrous iron transport protein B [Candidatus Synechococcus calcipolaris]MDG2990793.1 ferrous iron transport protein B [Candidatus Synechococcus calcipolaris G9]
MSEPTARIALVGMPNTGKSTFFNRITGAAARVANWPGITVDLAQATVTLNGQPTTIVDLPGIYDLAGEAADEAIVRQFLTTVPVRLVLIILNASQIHHQIRLVLQIKAWGVPALVLLNMADEAQRYGIKIDPHLLSQTLGLPVTLLSAKYGGGYLEAYGEISRALEQSAAAIAPLGNPETPLALAPITPEAIDELLQDGVQVSPRAGEDINQRLDSFLLHPLWGLPLFFLGIFLLFEAVWFFGLRLQEILSDSFVWFQEQVLTVALADLSPGWQGFFIDGIYGGIVTVAAFVPLVIIFFTVMAFIEDSGYLSRSAYLMDGLMARLGLDGRSFVLSLMGFGCNVPALMGTRVIRSPGLRLLTMLVIPFSLCSARLQVFVFMAACLFDHRLGPIIIVSLYLWSCVAAMGTALLFRGQFPNDESFVLELPPYRLPTVSQIFSRAWGEVRHFLQRASGFIITGVIGVWGLTHFPLNVEPASLQTWAGQIGAGLQPLLAPVGINAQLTIALIFGFVAKEIVVGSLAVIYHLQGSELQGAIAQQITPLQAYCFMLFTLLYTPCLSTLATLQTESKRWRFTLMATAYSLVLAWGVSGLIYQIGQGLGWH